MLQLEKEKDEKRKKMEEQRKNELMSKELKIVLSNKEAVNKVLNEQHNLETAQMQEQETAKQLISEASLKLSTSLKTNDLAGAKVAQVMLSAGNDKLQETSKQLSHIREEKDKCQQKLARLERKERDHAAVGLDNEPAAKKQK